MIAPFWDVPSPAPCSVSPAPPSGWGRVPPLSCVLISPFLSEYPPLPSACYGSFPTSHFALSVCYLPYIALPVCDLSLTGAQGQRLDPSRSSEHCCTPQGASFHVPCACMRIAIFMVPIAHLSHRTQWVNRSLINPPKPYYSETRFTGKWPRAFTDCGGRLFAKMATTSPLPAHCWCWPLQRVLTLLPSGGIYFSLSEFELTLWLTLTQGQRKK